MDQVQKIGFKIPDHSDGVYLHVAYGAPSSVQGKVYLFQEKDKVMRNEVS